jgi:hypothetical protein
MLSFGGIDFSYIVFRFCYFLNSGGIFYTVTYIFQYLPLQVQFHLTEFDEYEILDKDSYRCRLGDGIA